VTPSARRWSVVALAVTAFAVTYPGPINFTYGDPWGNLLTAQAILEQGTIKLDAYPHAHAIAVLGLDMRIGDHSYYFFPVGTPVLMLPAVGLALLAGQDMADEHDNLAMHKLLASLTLAAAVVLVFALCRLYLGDGYSLLVTAAFVFGSSIASTLGTALWSSNLAFLLNLAVIWLLARDHLGVRSANPYVVGTLLFLSYLCRPTAALLIVIVLGYFALARRPFLWRTSGIIALLFAGFVAFSWAEYGRLLPPYYDAASRLGSGTFWTALAGNVISPSRGVLVLSPFLILTMAGALAFRRRVLVDPLLRVALVWLTLHWIIVSTYVNWWGGWSFGNRFLIDVLPALILLTAVVGKEAVQTRPRARMRLLAAGFAAFAGVSVFIHTYQGMYSVHPLLWGEDGTYVDHLFEWRHPQFLASEASLAAHRRQHLLPLEPPRSLYDPVEPTSEGVIFANWFRPGIDNQWRWSRGTSATVLFRLENGARVTDGPLILEVVAGTFGPQRVTVFVNDIEVGTIESTVDWEPDTYRFEISDAALRGLAPGEGALPVAEIRFRMPGARSPASESPDGAGDPRVLALCLRGLVFKGAA